MNNRANASNCQTKTQTLYVPRFMRGIQPDPDVKTLWMPCIKHGTWESIGIYAQNLDAFALEFTSGQDHQNLLNSSEL